MLPVTTQISFPSPKCTHGASNIESFTVNYDFETVERGDPLIATTEIKEYNLLNFKGITFVDADPDFDGNHLAFSPGTEIVDNILAPNVSMATASYIESTLTSFTPKFFWYGCVTPFPYTSGSLPETCNITATRFDKGGRLLATQVFEFAATGIVVQHQKYGVFKGFDNVYSVAFGVKPVTTAALMYNFIAKLYQPECGPYYTGNYGNGT